MSESELSFDMDAHAATIERQGYTIIGNFLDAGTVAEVREGLAPYLALIRAGTTLKATRPSGFTPSSLAVLSLSA